MRRQTLVRISEEVNDQTTLERTNENSSTIAKNQSQHRFLKGGDAILVHIEMSAIRTFFILPVSITLSSLLVAMTVERFDFSIICRMWFI